MGPYQLFKLTPPPPPPILNILADSQIPVTNTNREEYVSALVDHLLVSGVKTAFDAFRRGFLTLCDGPSLSFLTAEELEEVMRCFSYAARGCAIKWAHAPPKLDLEVGNSPELP